MQEYREAYEQHKALRAECDYTDRLVEQARVKLLSDFDEWYSMQYAPPPPAAAAGSRGFDGAGAGDDDDDKFMDDQERFDRMEAERIMAEDPESLAFYNARKSQRERAKVRFCLWLGVVLWGWGGGGGGGGLRRC